MPTFRHRKQRFKQKKQIYHKKTFYKRRKSRKNVYICNINENMNINYNNYWISVLRINIIFPKKPTITPYSTHYVVTPRNVFL